MFSEAKQSCFSDGTVHFKNDKDLVKVELKTWTEGSMKVLSYMSLCPKAEVTIKHWFKKKNVFTAHLEF